MKKDIINFCKKYKFIIGLLILVMVVIIIVIIENNRPLLRQFENKNYSYAFTIISSIIDSFKESNYNDKCEIITNEYIKLGTLIRISYRKGDDTLKNNIDKWINNIESKEYYNDIYLEDMILSIKL
ncbi:MAG: hypothetical protein RSB72_00625 [Bacilli bacterium]